MKQALLIRLKPTGPWRYGPGDGGTDRVDTLFRSDRLFSAVTLACQRLGYMDEWLDATARSAEPQVALTSFFPFQAETLFAIPPSTLWPPPPALVTAPSPVFLNKLRWRAATLVPVSAIESILIGQPLLADQWVPDPDSGCLLRRDRPAISPYRIVVRSQAAVDRLSQGTAHPHTAACVEFETASGLWCAVVYRDETARERWDLRIRAAFRLLADTGFGARRSAGWGQTEDPQFQSGAWPALLMPKFAARANAAAADNGSLTGGEARTSQYWLLSLFTPAAEDAIDWKAGDYQLTVRGGYVQSVKGSGAKKQVRMITEGSVLGAGSEPVGAAIDVAPDEFLHPVYRAGLAVVLKLPALDLSVLPEIVETTPVPLDEPRTETAEGPLARPEKFAEPKVEKEAASYPTLDTTPEVTSDISADIQAADINDSALPPAELVTELSDETEFPLTSVPGENPVEIEDVVKHEELTDEV